MNGEVGGPIRGIQLWLGFLRSWLIYRAQPWRVSALVRFYAPFVGPGDLCFDVGAHIGNHTQAWLALGARVVAVEPQPLFIGHLRRRFRRQPRVRLMEVAIATQPGRARLAISRLTPTVSSLSPAWRDQVAGTIGFERVSWQEQLPVQVSTLDELIAEHGAPAFCKIDVEGGELEVLRGLSQPLLALSFEYLPAALDIAQSCVARLAKLGPYLFRWSQGEPPRLKGDSWVGPDQMAQILSGLSGSRRSGDVVARLRQGGGGTIRQRQAAVDQQG